MNFNNHSAIKGTHAFLSASGSAWVNYSPEKLETVYLNAMSRERGTALHELASQCIALKVKMPRTNKSFDRYINDAIGYQMTPEQVLFYSYNCFGTADAICFKKDYLRIHDLKNGVHVTNMNQLNVYAALFCLEYEHSPSDIGIELRKYQLDEVTVSVPDPEEIRFIMDRIIEFDQRINNLKRLG